MDFFSRIVAERNKHELVAIDREFIEASDVLLVRVAQILAPLVLFEIEAKEQQDVAQ